MATNPDRWSEEIDDFDDCESPLVDDDLCLEEEGTAEPEQNKPHVLTPLQLLEARQVGLVRQVQRAHGADEEAHAQ